MHTRAARLCRIGILVPALAVLIPPGTAAGDETLPVWGSVPSRDRGDQSSALLGIDVVGADDVWAVGEYNAEDFQTTRRRTLAQHWDGDRWRLVRTPNPSFEGIDFANLEGVSGVASDDVWAVGHGNDFATLRSRTLVEHWDGARWRKVKSPNPAGPALPNELHAVLARSADEVWAVGERGSPARALILQFDGDRWRVVDNSCGGGLRGITGIPGTSTLWAVGENTTCFFDGEEWSSVPQPGFPDLEDVSATSATDVWAVGFEVSCEPKFCSSRSVIQRWNGSQWGDVDHPIASQLGGVHVVAADDVWAVGTNNVGTVIQHWDGSDWSEVPSPDPESGGELAAIDGGGAERLWASGSFFDDESFGEQTLIVQAPSATQGQVVGDTHFSGATVSWFGRVTGSTSADQFGTYNIPALPAGRYTVIVTDPFGQCDPASATVRVVANQTTVQDFQLDC